MSSALRASDIIGLKSSDLLTKTQQPQTLFEVCKNIIGNNREGRDSYPYIKIFSPTSRLLIIKIYSQLFQN